MQRTEDVRSHTTTVTESSDHSKEPEQLPVPTQGCLLGVDFGTRRIGLAICDDRQVFATPLETYSRTVESIDARHLR